MSNRSVTLMRFRCFRFVLLAFVAATLAVSLVFGVFRLLSSEESHIEYHFGFPLEMATAKEGRIGFEFVSWNRIYFYVPRVTKNGKDKPHTKAEAQRVIASFKGDVLGVDVLFTKVAGNKVEHEILEWLLSQGIREIRFEHLGNNFGVVRVCRDGTLISESYN